MGKVEGAKRLRGVPQPTAGVTVRPSASATAVGDPKSLAPYWRFHRAVAEAQLRSWLPSGRRLLVDISGPLAGTARTAAAAGHRVLRIAGTHLPDGTDGAGQDGAGPDGTPPATSFAPAS